METQMTLPTVQKSSDNLDRFRTVLIISGIVVAIIVSIFLTRVAGSASGLNLELPQFATKAALFSNFEVSSVIDNLPASMVSLLDF